MKKSFVTVTFAGMTALAGLAAPVGAANAAAACYVSEKFPDERIVIDVEKQGLLVNPWYDLVALVFGGTQTAYSAHGKHVHAEQIMPPAEVAAAQVDWIYSMAAATGTVDVSSPFLKTNRNAAMHPTQTGAHMGLVAEWVRGDGYQEGVLWALPVTFDCGSEEISPTPNTWTCQVYNEFDVYWGTTTYTKVAKPADDERCNLFEAIPETAAPLYSGPASYGPLFDGGGAAEK